MWWFRADARYATSEAESVRVPCGTRWQVEVFQTAETRCEEAGTELFHQHDGTRPHIAKQNARSFSTHSKVKGFKITLAVQPPQTPDVNFDDLAFFRSLQTDVELIAKKMQRFACVHHRRICSLTV